MQWVSPHTTSFIEGLNLTFQGNIFATRPGKKSGPPTYAASHLDTQVSDSFHTVAHCGT